MGIHCIRVQSFPLQPTSPEPRLNMKLEILFALLAVAAAAPQQAVLRSSEARMNPDGSYKFSYEIDDGTRVVESGEQKEITCPELRYIFKQSMKQPPCCIPLTIDFKSSDHFFLSSDICITKRK